MSRKSTGLAVGTRGMAWAVCGCLALGTLVSAGSKDKRVVSKPKFDPSAERIEMFAALDQGALTAKVIAKDEFSGQVFFENLTDKPLTVQLPESIVAVQVLPQIAGGDGFGGGGAGGAGQGGGQGGGQAMGGGMGGMMGGMGGGMGGMGGGGMMGGGGFFSIPPEQIVRIKLHSVCLEHGKKPPRAGAVYKLIRPETFSDNADLNELLKVVGSGKLNRQAAQAAAWHIGNGMSWQELMEKKYNRVGVEDTPYFSQRELLGAQELVALARRQAEETAKTADQPQQPVRRDRVTGQIVGQ